MGKELLIGIEDYRLKDIEDTLTHSKNGGFGCFVYYPAQDTIWVPEAMARCFGNVQLEGREPILRRYVLDDTYDACDQIFMQIRNGVSKSACHFHSSLSHNEFSMRLSVLKSDEAGRPLVAIGVIDRFTGGIVPNQGTDDVGYLRMASEIASGISTLFYAIYYIWLREGTYVCYQERLNGAHEFFGPSGNYQTAWERYINFCIVPEDKELVRSFSDFSTLAERLATENTISCMYRRIGAGWARGMFVVGRRDRSGAPENLLYVVTDINAEVESEEQRRQVEHQAMHDGLTGVKNRAAFEARAQKGKFANAGGALILVDVDHFKDINDVYGHPFGDEVLRRVATQLIYSFGQHHVYRYGGDEFIVYLPEFSPKNWDDFCNRVHELHKNINQNVDEVRSITLSLGMSLSGDSLDEVIKRADAALYETKRRGRCGCSLFNHFDGNMLSWSDDIQGPDCLKIMLEHELGSWTLEIGDISGRQLMCDSLMREKLAIPQGLDAHGIWEFFWSRLSGRSVYAVEHMIGDMNRGRMSEVLLQWEHPFKGLVFVRSGGFLDKVQSAKIGHSYYCGYVHLLDGVHIISGYDDITGIHSALGEQYFCNYYINLPQQSFVVYKEQEDMNISRDASSVNMLLENFINIMCAKENRDLVANFLNPATLMTRLKNVDFIEQEFLSTSETYGWCQARIIVVERDPNGNILGCCLVVESVAESHAKRIAEQKEHEHRVMVLERMVAMLSRGTMLAMGYIEPDGRISYEENRLGFDAGAHTADDFLVQEMRYVDAGERDSFVRAMGRESLEKALNENGQFNYTTMMRRNDRVHRIVTYHACREGGESQRILFLIEDVSGPSSVDSVSGALNREGLLLHGCDIMERVHTGERLCLIDFNICNFRAINTVYDFASGDLVLRTAANYLKQSAIEPILVCRNKDDRFFCIVPEEKANAEVLQECRRFKVKLRDGVHEVEFLCGVCPITESCQSLAVCADQAMAAVQKVRSDKIQSGICFFNEDMARSYRDRVYVLENLDVAINEEQFVVMYQPVYDASTGIPVSAEALVRWKHPTRGMVPPFVFVPALEELGLMYRVDHYVQQQVLKFQQRRLKAGRKVVPVAVNMSRADLYNEEFLRQTEELLNTEDFPPELIRFEITESCFAELPPSGIRFLEGVRNRGCHILIDDFGTGVSALRTVADGDYDILKLDKSFVDGIGNSSKLETVIASTINLGHSLGLGVTAEGVETQSQYQYLKDIGCNYIQGYLFSKPVSEDELDLILDNIPEDAHGGAVII